MKKIRNFQIRTDLSYDPETLYWLDIQGNMVRIGMSPLVQETSGSFVAVQFGAVGSSLERNGSFGSAEAEKHVGPLKSPVSGRITATNPMVLENPRLLNTDPYGKGWLVEIEMSQFDVEKAGLVEGPDKVEAWFESEIQKYEEKGWLAES